MGGGSGGRAEPGAAGWRERSTGTGLEGMQAAVTRRLLAPAWDTAACASPGCPNDPKPFARSHRQALQGVSTQKHLSYPHISLPSPQNALPLRPRHRERRGVR